VNRYLVLLTITVLMPTACGLDAKQRPVADAPPRETGAALRPSTSSPPEPLPTSQGTQGVDEPAQEPAGRAVEVWLTAGAHLFLTHRTIETTPAVARAAIEALLAGPTEREAAAGVSSAVGRDAALSSLTIDDGIATIELSGFGSPGGTTAEMLSIAQVTYTLTQFPTVDGVLFEAEDRPLRTGHGIDLSRPQTRHSWNELVPPIVVTTPATGEAVSSPVEVTGTANVFEATVSLRLLDGSGRELDQGFTTATCGTGCRGDFSHQLRFEVAREQEGVIEVWWDSPEDGSRQDLVQIPVTLAP